MSFRSYKKESRGIDWGTSTDKPLNIEQLQLGATLRIADAMELMAQNYASLISERDRFERYAKEERGRREQLERRVNALRGVITKMKGRKE